MKYNFHLFSAFLLSTFSLVVSARPVLSWELPGSTLFGSGKAFLRGGNITKEGELVVVANDNEVIRISPAGKVNLRVQVPWDLNTRVITDNSGNIFVGNSSKASKLDTDGKELWNFQDKEFVYHYHPLAVSSEGDLIAVSGSQKFNYLMRIRGSTGELAWKLRLQTKKGTACGLTNAVIDAKGSIWGSCYTPTNPELAVIFRADGTLGKRTWEYIFPKGQYAYNGAVSVSPNGRYALVTLGGEGKAPPLFFRVDAEKGESPLQSNFPLTKGFPQWAKVTDSGEFWVALQNAWRGSEQGISIIFKYDSMGKVQWESPVVTVRGGGYNGFEVDDLGNLIVSGSRIRDEFPSTFYAFSLDAKGKMRWDYFHDPMPEGYQELSSSRLVYNKTDDSFFLVGTGTKSGKPFYDYILRFSP